MKKATLLILIIAVVGGMVLVPFFKNNNSTEEAVKFDFQENLATKWNTIIPLSFTVIDSDVEQVEVFYEDSLVHSFKQPMGKVEFKLNAGYFGLGTRALNLKAKMKDGSLVEDNRLLRILSDVEAKTWKIRIVNSFPHNPENFTQGLEFDGTNLFESTGDPNQQGKTILGPVNIRTGEHLKKIGLDATYFGEGITILGDKIYQLTYTQGKCFVYDKTTLALINEFTYAGEGWGLCNDGTYLYMSNGTERITKRDPKTFQVIETIEVYDTAGPIRKLNELEFVDGIIFANVWMTNAIVAFQPENGKLLAVIDASELAKLGANGGDVLNGIAYQNDNKTLFLTGKYWTKLFEVKVERQQ